MLILSTSAQIAQDEQARHTEYLDGWSSLGPYQKSAIVLECFLPKGPSLLEKEGLPIIYIGKHSQGIRNKGVLEAKSLLSYLDNSPHIPESDMLVKVTGRYSFTSPSFLNEVISLSFSNLEAIVKKDAHGQVFTGCFAIRKGILHHILKTIDFQKMEENMVNLERLIADGLHEHKILEISSIGMVAPIFGAGLRDILKI